MSVRPRTLRRQPLATRRLLVRLKREFGEDVEAITFGCSDEELASLCEDKYAAGDTARIVEYDSTVGDTGNWVPVTDVANIGGDRCS